MNQSETNPLATALAALMTGHNANPNTSLRIPLVDSNGNLQPGPTLAELASVLGDIFYGSPEITNGTNFVDIPLGISYYANPHTASDAPTDIVQNTNYDQCIIIKRGNTPSMNRGFMTVINKWGIAVKFKGANWDPNWKYLITLQ